MQIAIVRYLLAALLLVAFANAWPHPPKKEAECYYDGDCEADECYIAYCKNYKCYQKKDYTCCWDNKDCPSKPCQEGYCDDKTHKCSYKDVVCTGDDKCYDYYCDEKTGKCVKEPNDYCCWDDKDCPSKGCKIGYCDAKTHQCAYKDKICYGSKKCYTYYCDDKTGLCMKTKKPGCCYSDKECYVKDKCKYGYCDKKTWTCKVKNTCHYPPKHHGKKY